MHYKSRNIIYFRRVLIVETFYLDTKTSPGEWNLFCASLFQLPIDHSLLFICVLFPIDKRGRTWSPTFVYTSSIGTTVFRKFMQTFMVLDTHDVLRPFLAFEWSYLVLSVGFSDGCINGCLLLTVLPAK